MIEMQPVPTMTQPELLTTRLDLTAEVLSEIAGGSPAGWRKTIRQSLDYAGQDPARMGLLDPIPAGPQAERFKRKLRAYRGEVLDYLITGTLQAIQLVDFHAPAAEQTA